MWLITWSDTVICGIPSQLVHVSVGLLKPVQRTRNTETAPCARYIWLRCSTKMFTRYFQASKKFCSARQCRSRKRCSGKGYISHTHHGFRLITETQQTKMLWRGVIVACPSKLGWISGCFMLRSQPDARASGFGVSINSKFIPDSINHDVDKTCFGTQMFVASVADGPHLLRPYMNQDSLSKKTFQPTLRSTGLLR